MYWDPFAHLTIATFIYFLIRYFCDQKSESLSMSKRYTISVVSGWIFLLTFILVPPWRSIARDVQYAVCSAGAVGLAISAFKFKIGKPIASIILLVISVYLLGSLCIDWFQLFRVYTYIQI